jgi:nicotinamide phosphoribosyltransferase
MAHLVNFRGSDTIPAVEGCFHYYGEENASDTIPATEHSIMAALGEEGEFRQMEKFLDVFKDYKGPAIACVSDTYDIYKAVTEGWGGELKAKVEALSDKVLVVRPDSGEPATIVRQVAERLETAFGVTINEKGYKVLNHVRIIQGDGVNLDSIREILEALDERKFSADNVAFGMGGALLQGVNRDTQKFAIKASSMVINGRLHDIQKRPVTDNTKRSKAGRLKLIRDENGVLSTVPATEIGHDLLETVFENGKIMIFPKFSDIRERAEVRPTNLEAWQA